jgi:hypothetical protein
MNPAKASSFASWPDLKAKPTPGLVDTTHAMSEDIAVFNATRVWGKGNARYQDHLI